MNRRARCFGLVILSILAVSCGQEGPEPTQPSFQTNEWCDTHPIECNGGIADPDPSAPGYYLGASITPAKCFSATGVGIGDSDRDGMSDSCENVLAQAFRPSLNLAPPNYDCDPSMEPYWAAKYFPRQGSVVRIAYLFAYHSDCGDSGLVNRLLAEVVEFATLKGVINNLAVSFGFEVSTDDPGGGHSGDSEFVMVDVRFNGEAQHWVLSRVKYSAHYGTDADGSRTTTTSGVQYPDKYAGYPRVWVARNKHANYPSRESCKSGRGPLGLLKDNCDANLYDKVRFLVTGFRNIGSLHRNFINQGSCVSSAQPVFYPGTECFWVPTDHFFGWARYPVGHPPTPYFSILVPEFECYSYTGSSARTCSDFGVVR